MKHFYGSFCISVKYQENYSDHEMDKKLQFKTSQYKLWKVRVVSLVKQYIIMPCSIYVWSVRYYFKRPSSVIESTGSFSGKDMRQSLISVGG